MLLLGVLLGLGLGLWHSSRAGASVWLWRTADRGRADRAICHAGAGIRNGICQVSNLISSSPTGSDGSIAALCFREPMGEISRLFVDHAGWLNQKLAKQVNQVTFIAAGLAMPLKDSGG